METDGIVEKIKPGMNTDWSSALHLANKPGGGVRPCTDFRDLNKKTVTDAHPLPPLKDFTSKIHGSNTFSKGDLRSALFNIPIWPAHRHKTLTLSPWGGPMCTTDFPLAWLQDRQAGKSCWKKSLRTYQTYLFIWTTYLSLVSPKPSTMRSWRRS